MMRRPAIDEGRSRRQRRPLIVWLIVIGLLAYAGQGPLLMVAGDVAMGTRTEMRRTGGAEERFMHQYFWVVSYAFSTADGARHTVHSRKLAADSGPRGYALAEKVFYLPSVPIVNVLARDAGPGIGTAGILALAGFLLWLSAPRDRAGRHSAVRATGRSRKDRAPNAGQQSLSAEQTAQWLRRYRSHGRTYAWGFFTVVVLLVSGVIWLELGALDEEAWYALGFFVFVFLLLALWSRRATSRGWQGLLHDKTIAIERIRRDDVSTGQQVERRVLHVDTGDGEVMLRVSPELFDYFEQGDRLFKVPGFDWPEKTALGADHRACIACGAVLDRDAARCPRCSAPVPDHAALLRLTGVQAEVVRGSV
jgi:hypothetical protein